MEGGPRLRRSRVAAVGLAAVMAVAGLAQERAVTLSGTLFTGFYATSTRDARQARIRFVPVGANVDLTGFIGHPDFLSYEVRPQVSAGPQSTEAGFLGANGISFNTTFLKGRSFPLRLSYSNLQREDVFFASLTQVSGFRSLNHQRNLGLNWEWRAPRWPQLSFDLGQTRLTTEPDLDLVSAYRSHSRYAGLEMKDKRWGWTIDGVLRRDNLSSSFSNPLAGDLRATDLVQGISDARLTANRPLGRTSDLSLGAGRLNNRVSFADRPVDQNVRFSDATLTFGQGQRLQGGLRAGYTSNLIGAVIQDGTARSSGDRTPALAGPELLLITPLPSRVSHLSLSGHSRYQPHRDLGFFASVNRDRVRNPENRLAVLNSEFLTGTAGLNAQHRFSWASLMGQYSRIVGRTVYGGLHGRLRGENLSLTAQAGAPDKLEVAGTLSHSRQRTIQTLIFRGGTDSADLTLARRILGVTLRGGLGVERMFFRDAGADYRGEGLRVHGSAEHSRLQFSYSHHVAEGNTMRALGAGSAADMLALGLAINPFLSAQRGDTLMFRANPHRRLEVNFNWIRSNQHFDRRAIYDSDQLELRAAYRFRLLTFELGYVRYDYSFLDFRSVMRNRTYFRLSRPFRVF